MVKLQHMKKSWLAGVALVLFVLLMGLSFYLRPSPQESLVMGIKTQDLDSIRVAMQRGADATLPIERGNRANTTPGYTPLQLFLVSDNRPEGLQLLLQRADLRVQSKTGTMVEPDKRDGFEATPLHYVTHRGNSWPPQNAKATLQLLLDKGAPINAKANYPAGLTPLMLARQEWLMRFLLERGADPDLVTAGGACLMNYSGKEPTHPLWKLLKKHGGRPRRVPDSRKFPRPIFASGSSEITGWVYALE